MRRPNEKQTTIGEYRIRLYDDGRNRFTVVFLEKAGNDALWEVQMEKTVTGLAEADRIYEKWMLDAQAFRKMDEKHIKRLEEEEKRDEDWGSQDEWRQEIAHQEGMLHGIDARNDALGYGQEAPPYCDQCGFEHAGWCPDIGGEG